MPKRIKIVHVVHSLGVGGLENGLVNLLNQLDDQFSHTIVCLSRSGRMAERIKSRNSNIIEMGLPTDKFRFPIVRLSRVFQSVSPDIVHTRGWSTVDAICAARVAGVSHVIHGEHGREASDPNGRNRKRNIVRKCLSPLVQHFVAVSDDLRLWLTETVGIPKAKVTTIHNGVDTSQFSPEGRKAARRSLGLDESAFIIGTVGRLDPVKDHESLLKAFAPIARSQRRVCLMIVGDGPGRKEIVQLCTALQIADKVMLLGERRDIPILLKACDVFTLTSIAEGISNTILEAMASGLPIVATRVGGNLELVEHGASGHLVTAKDVTALSRAYESYLHDPDICEKHGRSARFRAEQKFSLERMASQYNDLYQTVMGKTEERAA
ncbi:MAG TPA: glycosyltransferase [Acidobacteriota bacterium]|nr:glycosyltransferase [Acidobacteriota bacterium]